MTHKPQTPAEIVAAFRVLFDQVAPETPAEVDEVLRATGYDPEEVGARYKRLADAALAKAADRFADE